MGGRFRGRCPRLVLTHGRRLARVPPVRRERNYFHWALLVSLILHVLLLFFIVPGFRQVWTLVPEPVVQMAPPPEEQRPPLQFEFVDLAEDREEAPTNQDDAPLSDLDRRAHGGEGERSNRAASQGNTPQLVQAEGGQQLAAGAPPQQAGPPVEPVRPNPSEAPNRDSQQETDPRPEGAGENKNPVPTPQPQNPRIVVPQPGAITLPSDAGGFPENPDRQGGQVDTGGLSFDTQWYDWGPYAKMMLAKIRRNWNIPTLARMGVPGRVRIRFFIESDGTVTGMQILDESGKPPMDFAARDAIGLSSPFNPLPPELRSDREGVTITFFYNSKPPE